MGFVLDFYLIMHILYVFYLVFPHSHLSLLSSMICMTYNLWTTFVPHVFIQHSCCTCNSLWTMSNEARTAGGGGAGLVCCALVGDKWSEPSFVHLKWCFEFRMQKTFCYIADFNVFNKCNMQIKCSVYWVFKLKMYIS